MTEQKKFSPISCERVRLRDFTTADLSVFAAYRNDPAVARYQSWSEYSMADAEAFFMLQKVLYFAQPGSWYQIAIADNQTDKLLGDCVIHFLEHDNRQVELGMTLATENQGKGYGREVMVVLMDFLFNRLDMHRVIALTDALNTGSIKLLETMGFRREAHYVENVWFKGQWGSEYLYAMLKREFLLL